MKPKKIKRSVTMGRDFIKKMIDAGLIPDEKYTHLSLTAELLEPVKMVTEYYLVDGNKEIKLFSESKEINKKVTEKRG